MRRVFLSFLGTNDYLPCNYHLVNHPPVENVRFIQEACISRLCEQWTDTDRIVICMTKESHDKNWVDDGHEDREGQKVCREGLGTRLESLGLSTPVEIVMIPSGKKEKEIWDIFDLVLSQLIDEDQLYLDITHAFRSLPMLAMVILSYAKVMRNISVSAISYGAMEAIGSIQEVQKMEIAERDVPVFDLLPFDSLQDWIIAVDRFTATGDGKMIQKLADENITPLLIQTKGQDADAVGIRKLGRCLVDFSSAVATCRGRDVTETASRLLESYRKVQNQEIIKPLKPLLHKLEHAIAGFKGDEIEDGLAAARWCLHHNLYQQGYTILQETMITFIVNTAINKNGRDLNDRTLVNQVVSIILNNVQQERWKPEAQKDIATTCRMISWMKPQEKLVKSMRNLSNIRNDLNHSGQNENPIKPETICNQLEEYINEMELIVAHNRA